jgi:hypothetical protein
MWIGISGKMGAGKDYFTEHYLVPYLENVLKEKCYIISFADMIKINIMVHHNLNYEQLYGNKTNDVRTLLRNEGQDAKKTCGDDIWIRYVKGFGEVQLKRGIKHIIITDVRFINEYEFIKSMNGIVIRIDAPQRTEKRLKYESMDIIQYEILKTHISEIELDDFAFEYIINNDNTINIVNLHLMFNKLFIKKYEIVC